MSQRQQIRIPVKGFAVVKSRHGAVAAEAVDISEAGVCLTLPHPLEVGDVHRLDLEVRIDEKRARRVVGRVCFCLAQQGRYRIGFNCSLEEFLG